MSFGQGDIRYGSNRDFFPTKKDKILAIIQPLAWCLTMPTRFMVKHVILLRLLDNHTNAKPFGTANEVKTVRISEDALAFRPLTKESIRNFYKDLVSAQEVCAYYYDSIDKLEFSILDNGIMAVSNKKYFYEGLNARFKPLLLPVFLIIITAIATYYGAIKLEIWKQINVPSK